MYIEEDELSEVVGVQGFLAWLGAERQAVCDYRASALLEWGPTMPASARPQD
jgi:hypothetical protein